MKSTEMHPSSSNIFMVYSLRYWLVNYSWNDFFYVRKNYFLLKSLSKKLRLLGRSIANVCFSIMSINRVLLAFSSLSCFSSCSILYSSSSTLAFLGVSSCNDDSPVMRQRPAFHPPLWWWIAFHCWCGGRLSVLICQQLSRLQFCLWSP